jgi:hypothetical protein
MVIRALSDLMALAPIDFVAFARACGGMPGDTSGVKLPRAALVEAVVDANENLPNPTN